MRFEARELRSYAEPLSAEELAVGEIYFAVHFMDEQMLVPVMDTLVFIGRDLESDDSGRLYFQDVGSYWDGVRYATATDDDRATFIMESADKPWIFGFEQALEMLMECSLKRQRARAPDREAGPST
jgi:hypothetical protein